MIIHISDETFSCLGVFLHVAPSTIFFRNLKATYSDFCYLIFIDHPQVASHLVKRLSYIT